MRNYRLWKTAMNNFHRYLNLPFDLEKPKLFDTTPNHVVHQHLDGHYDNNIERFLKQFGLELLLTECFYTPPNGGKVPIHTDFWWYETDFVKINQTWGPDDGEIIWWNCKKTYEIVLDNNTYTIGNDTVTYADKAKVLRAEETDCKQIFSANTNRPSLVNTGVLHSTINPSNQGRWTVCFIPVYKQSDESYIKWDDAVNIFKDYIDE